MWQSQLADWQIPERQSSVKEYSIAKLRCDMKFQAKTRMTVARCSLNSQNQQKDEQDKMADQTQQWRLIEMFRLIRDSSENSAGFSKMTDCSPHSNHNYHSAEIKHKTLIKLRMELLQQFKAMTWSCRKELAAEETGQGAVDSIDMSMKNRRY